MGLSRAERDGLRPTWAKGMSDKKYEKELAKLENKGRVVASSDPEVEAEDFRKRSRFARNRWI